MATQKSKSETSHLKLDTRGFSRSLITNLKSRLKNYKLRIQYGDPKIQKWDQSFETGYSGIFKVADYKSQVKVEKLKIAHLRWWSKNPNQYSGLKIQKMGQVTLNCVPRGFQGRWSQIKNMNYKKKNHKSKMAYRKFKRFK